ncbi:MAG: ABC transporter permease [Acidobacteriota bacterium]
MRLRRGFALSVRALTAHRVRAGLATASVAIGVASVLVTSALGQGARDAVLRDVGAMGANLLLVRPAQLGTLVARREVRGRVTSLRAEDCEEIAALACVREAAPGSERDMRIKVGPRSMDALVMGTGAAFRSLRGLTLSSGRFFDPAENDAAERVAVLGARVADTLFPGQRPIRESLRINGIPFQVVGVLAARGVLADGSDEDGNVFVPIRTALRRLFNTTSLSEVFVAAAHPDRMEEAEQEIRRLLRDRHRLAAGRPDDFDIQNQAKLLAVRAAVADSLTLLATGLAGVSLVVGGIGVLAVMLLSVKERTAEIGLRMALGARPADVFTQFLVEASALALGGWVAGAAAGGLGAATLAIATSWTVGAPRAGLVASFAVTVLTGVAFGALPARKAARMVPIDVLRAS